MLRNSSSDDNHRQAAAGSESHDARGVFFGAWAVAAGVLLVCAGLVQAAEYTVKLDGTGKFRTIQACADAAMAGDTCSVYAGTYSEHVETARGGVSDDKRITFKAHGVVTMQGFDIQHPYVTVEGFDITGYRVSYAGHITVAYGGDYCQIRNNTIRDGLAKVAGLDFSQSDRQVANHCVVVGNTLSNLRYVFLDLNGDGHLFEQNTFENQNGMDFIRLFGTNHVFRRNVFRNGATVADSAGHPDFVQTFGRASGATENHLFEENWIQNLQSQFSQLNSGDGVVMKGILYANVRNVVFRRNIILNVSYNANIGMPGVRFENNTIYRLAHQLSGISFGGSLTRGDATGGVLKGNVFLAGSSRALAEDGSSGYYSLSGAVLGKEVIAVFVTKERNSSGNITSQGPIAAGLFNNLKSSGYINSNGGILSKARSLSSISQFVLSDSFSAFKQAMYEHLMKTVQLDASIRSTFLADYNFVAGSEAAGFPAKRSVDCVAGATYTGGNFCEPHGVNGGSPELSNLANPLGPDGIPFTLDDGLKPTPGSPLCGKGEGGADIGAYSCDPNKVFPNQPKPPGNLIIR